uniref:Uncharacterized protein n=1 Tax=viral metagenome TaxID=1070528 RepID=A0A6C0H9H8_9ZZZZ
MNCSTLELVKAREDAYYALKFMKMKIRIYEKRQNQYNIKDKNLCELKHREKIINSKWEILNNQISIINLKIDKINIKKNIPSIYHKKCNILEDNLIHYNLQYEQLILECERISNNLGKINRKRYDLQENILILTNTLIDLKKEYQQAWLTLKKYNEIYEYECIKQLIDKFIINNDTKIQILVELDNWKNEFIKISNSVYAIEDPNFVRIFDFGCDSTNPSISIYSSSDSE